MGVYALGRVPRIVVGQGSLEALAGAINDLRPGPTGVAPTAAVLVVDDAVYRTGYCAHVTKALGGMPHALHVVAAGEPSIASVNSAAEAVRSHPAAVVIGIGGGSALDTAKQAAVVAVGNGGVEQYLLCANPFTGRRPIVAIPTTSGTGAEVTRTCILSDAEGRKLWTWGDEMLPDVVVLDPEATITMPAHVTVATGLDAFVHALEACSGQRRNTMSAALAMQALRLVREHLPKVATDGGNHVARQGMQEAALLAGTAIDNCGTGIAHSIGHALGTLYHVPHGVAVAVGLHASIGWNVAGAAECFETASTAFDASAAELPAMLDDLFGATGFAAVVSRLPDQRFDGEMIAAVMTAEENEPMVANNCRVPTRGECRELAETTVESWNALREQGRSS